jgi:sensor histidine kinase regulating citrate/malate metabolism
MEKVFYKKGTSILVIASILVVVLLLCMLLTFLAQSASFTQKQEYVNKLIAQAKEDIANQKDIIEFKQTDAYIIEWAIAHGLISADDYLFIKDYLPTEGK